MPTFTVSNGNLSITDGSYTAATLPTGEDVTVGSGSITSQGSFSGTVATVSVKGTPAGTVSQPTFSGTEVTPAGTVSQPTFSGTEVTPAGTVSQPTFSGTQGTVTVG